MRTRIAPLLVLILSQPVFAAPPVASVPREPARDLYGDPIRAGAHLRLGTTRFRHGGAQFRFYLGFTDEGTIVSAAGRSIRFWNPQTGKLLRKIELGQKLDGFEFGPDARRAAILSDRFDQEQKQYVRTLTVRNLSSGDIKSTIAWTGQPGGTLMEFTPDGQTIINSGGDGTLQFREVGSGQELLKYRLADHSIETLSVSPDGRLVAAAARKTLFLWPWLSGKEPKTIETDKSAESLAFSPDGKILAVSFGRVVQLWNVETKRRIRQLRDRPKQPIYARSLTFLPDGKSLIATNSISSSIHATDERIVLWNAATGRVQQTLHTGSRSPGPIGISPDGRYLTARSGARIVVWDLDTGQPTTGDRPGHQLNVTRIAFLPGKERIVTAGDDGTVRVWNDRTGEQVRAMRHGHWVRAIDVSPDGRYIASSSQDDTDRLWEAGTGKEIYRLFGHGDRGGRRALAFSPHGRWFASWGDDMFLRVWDVETGKALKEHAIRPSGVEIPEDEDGAARLHGGSARWLSRLHVGASNAFSADARVLVLALGRTLHAFNVDTGREIGKFTGKYSVWDHAVSPRGKYLLTAGPGRATWTKLPGGRAHVSRARHHAVQLRKLPAGNEQWKLPLPNGGGRGPLAFSPDGSHMAAGLREPYNQIRIWDVATRKELLRINVDGIWGPLAFSPDGNRLACEVDNQTVLVWNLMRLGLPKNRTKREQDEPS